jgi:hypothetical protein
MYGNSYTFRHYIAIISQKALGTLPDDTIHYSFSLLVMYGSSYTFRHYIAIISQKALGTLPDDSNVMPKHVGATIHT